MYSSSRLYADMMVRRERREFIEHSCSIEGLHSGEFYRELVVVYRKIEGKQHKTSMS